MYSVYVDAMDRFLKTYNSAQTRRSYRWMLDRMGLFLETMGARGLADLTPDLFDSFLNLQPWNANSRYLAYCAARAFMRWTFGDNHPLAGYHMHRPKPRPQRTLGVDQAADLLQGIDSSTEIGRRHLAMIVLMLNTGARSFEVSGALLQDLDLQDRRLHIHGKGDRWRTARFSAYTAACLGSWLGVRAAWAAELPQVAPTLFISTRTGGPVEPSNIRHIFARLARRTGLAALSPHDLRRTFATLATRAGASARVVMAAGGWSSIGSLMRYTQAVNPDDLAPYDPVNYIMKIEGGKLN